MLLPNLFSTGVNDVPKEGTKDDFLKPVTPVAGAESVKDEFSQELQKNIDNNNKKQLDSNQSESDLEANTSTEKSKYDTGLTTNPDLMGQMQALDDVQSKLVNEKAFGAAIQIGFDNSLKQSPVISGNNLPVTPGRSDTGLPQDVIRPVLESLTPIQRITDSGLTTNQVINETTGATPKQTINQQFSDNISLPQQQSQLDTKLANTAGNTASDAKTAGPIGQQAINTSAAATAAPPVEGNATAKLPETNIPVSDPKLANGQPNTTLQAEVRVTQGQRPDQAVVTQKTTDAQAVKTSDVGTRAVPQTSQTSQSQAEVVKSDNQFATTNKSVAQEKFANQANQAESVRIVQAQDAVIAKQSPAQQKSVAESIQTTAQTRATDIPVPVAKPTIGSESKAAAKEVAKDSKPQIKTTGEISLDPKVAVDKPRAPIARLLGMGAIVPPAVTEPVMTQPSTNTGTTVFTTAAETLVPTRSDMTSLNQTSGITPARETPLPVHVPRNIWNQRFAEHISMLTLKGASQARIKLDPPELGPMMVRIVHGAETSIQFTVNNPIARDLVDSGMQRLRDMLEQQGFDQVDVDVREFKEEAHNDDSQASDLDETEIAHLKGNDTDNNTQQPIETYRESIGIIDIFA